MQVGQAHSSRSKRSVMMEPTRLSGFLRYLSTIGIKKNGGVQRRRVRAKTAFWRTTFLGDIPL